ncbi:MAG: Uma2 family endonuclease [Chroococcidiopsidaceae cyanobacterium CP_BM_ER_R8_30]|nr:Uma2 family endonuclease [Chroococcidiopsidaceae cyanobacterium CP_BM_ER_R8_30]
MTLTSQKLPTTRLWTVDEYHRMVKAGILGPDERVELIAGEVISMAAKNPPHVLVGKLASAYLEELLKGIALVRTQDPIHLDVHSEPEPDISVVIPPPRRYAERHPEPEDVYLIIEVSDATLQYDLTIKAKAYARALIQDYWAVDVNERKVYIYRKPISGDYVQKDVFSDLSSIHLLAFPEIEVLFKGFFP